MTPTWVQPRIDGLLQQLAWFLSHGIEPHYLAYRWPDDLIDRVGRVAQVTVSSARTTFPEARNWQLAQLEATHDAWGLLVDDDAIFDTEPARIRGNPIQWLQQGGDFPGVDMFIPVSTHVRGAGAWKDWFSTQESQDVWRF